MPENKLFEEYVAVMENTKSLSDRRQTLGDLFLGINSLFLAAAGFVAASDHLASWWPVGIVCTIAVITIFMNTRWYKLINSYRTLINLRVRYLEALERALQDSGAFNEITLFSEDGKEKHSTLRGVHLIEKDATYYRKGAQVGFFKLERDLVVTFIVAYIVLTVATAAFTFLVMNHILPPLILSLPIGG